MIYLESINKKYNDRYILHNFDMKVSKGEFICITGSSGVGKTTLLNIIGFLVSSDSGIIKINGIENPTNKEIKNLRRYFFTHIFQNYILINEETVYKNLLISKAYNKEFNKEKVIDNLNFVGLDKSYLDKKVYELSGGEQQRVSIARAILKPYEIILADEPTGNLDEENTKNILDIFLRLKENGKTIICVTHNSNLYTNSDRTIVLQKNNSCEV